VRRRAIGIDFSGARDAGRRIWIAEGDTGDTGCLKILTCMPVFQRLNCSKHREFALPALAEWITQQQDAVIGCDFPFSLPRMAIDETLWHEFVRRFPSAFPSAPQFRAVMRRRYATATIKEPKRVTDGADEAATPWNPWNIRLYRQTHAGIGSILAPLIGRASIAPFDSSRPGTPLIVETCPASSLKKLGLYMKYKGRTGTCREARAGILTNLVDRKLVSVDAALFAHIVDDNGGDALDAVIAALGAIAALAQIENGDGRAHTLEGWVYYVRG
jgi:hypothetical protein